MTTNSINRDVYLICLREFDNFVYMMKETKYFKEDEEGYLSASKITKRAKKLYKQFFDKDFLEFVDNFTS